MTDRNDKRWIAASDLAGRQYGALSFEDLRRCGFEPFHIESAVNSKRLLRVHTGVFALGYIPLGREFRWMAAVLACGPEAVLSHRPAATLWRIRDGLGPRIDITAPGRHNRPGILPHCRRLAPQDRAVRFGIPVTSVACTIRDLADELDDDEIARTLSQAQYLRLFDLAAVREILERRPSRKLQPFIDDLVFLQTGIEREFFGMCARAGLPRPATQRKVQGQRVDFYWEEQRLVVETDGWWAHSTFAAFQTDRARTNALLLDDYLVLRFTFADITRRPVKTAGQIRRALCRLDRPYTDRNYNRRLAAPTA